MKTLTIPTAIQPTGNIMDRVKTFDDACKALGIQQSELTVSGDMEQDFKSLSAYAKLIIIARALNEGWTPDWTNGKWDKYYPWFDLSSGSGLRYGGCDGQGSGSDVGSRLCFKSRELAEYAGKQFIDIYTDYFII